MRLRYIFISLLISIPFIISARDIEVHGIIMDTLVEEPLFGAYISYEGQDGKTYDTCSDIDGLFSITVPDSIELTATYFGYTPVRFHPEECVSIEMEFTTTGAPALWIIDGKKAVVDDLYLWAPMYCWGTKLNDEKSSISDKLDGIGLNDIIHFNLIRKSLNYQGKDLVGTCHVSTRPMPIEVVVDGKRTKSIIEYPGRLSVREFAEDYSRKKLKYEKVVTAALIDSAMISKHFPEVTTDKALVIITSDSCPHISATTYRRYIDNDGKEDEVSEGMYRIVDSEGNMGFATADGYVVVTPQYNYAMPFSSGYSTVYSDVSYKELENGCKYPERNYLKSINRLGL